MISLVGGAFAIGVAGFARVTNPSLYKSDGFSGNLEPETANPALEFLKKACALFASVSEENDEMAWNCPHCNCPNPEMWQRLLTVTNVDGRALSEPMHTITVQLPQFTKVNDGTRVYYAESAEFIWTKCRNSACGKLVAAIHFGAHYAMNSNPTLSEIWFAIPQRKAPRPIDEIVPEPFHRDYIEASLALTDSPRMSAVLARKILADLLETYGKVTRSLKLSKMIDAFLDQGGHPSHVTDNLHYLREIADFAAHTQKDTLGGNIVDVEPGEAEWTLETVDTLFDYFIVAREKDKQRRVDFDKKLEATGRKPLSR